MKGMASIVYVDNGIAKKQYRPKSEDSPEKRIDAHWLKEIEGLGRLDGRKHFPKIIALNHSTRTIYMNDCGVVINKDNIPGNWEKQCQEINDTFADVGVFHLDFKGTDKNGKPIIKNILVKNGIINVIDFGLWTDDINNYEPIESIIQTFKENWW